MKLNWDELYDEMYSASHSKGNKFFPLVYLEKKKSLLVYITSSLVILPEGTSVTVSGLFLGCAVRG